MQYSLGNPRIDDFYDGNNINIDTMIDAASTGKFGNAVSRAALRTHIEKYINADFDLLQFTSGHDVCGAIGVGLRNVLGKRHLHQTFRTEIEMHLRLSSHRPDFIEVGLLAKIVEWEEDNKPYCILA